MAQPAALATSIARAATQFAQTRCKESSRVAHRIQTVKRNAVCVATLIVSVVALLTNACGCEQRSQPRDVESLIQLLNEHRVKHGYYPRTLSDSTFSPEQRLVGELAEESGWVYSLAKSGQFYDLIHKGDSGDIVFAYDSRAGWVTDTR